MNIMKVGTIQIDTLKLGNTSIPIYTYITYAYYIRITILRLPKHVKYCDNVQSRLLVILPP